MSNVVKFPSASPERPRGGWSRPYTRRGPNMQTFCFRSYELIVQSDDADLLRDVSLDVDKARTKLRLVQQRLKGVKEQAAAQIEQLTTAETKLKAAIVAAMLSGQR